MKPHSLPNLPANPALLQCAVLLLVATIAMPASAQNCDCSCESYKRLQQVMEEYEQQQDSGDARSVPPELMQMGMCAGQCAMKWAQCENPDMDLSGMQQAQQRALERAEQQGGSDYSGDDAIARERAIHERSIGETEKNLDKAKAGLPKDQLSGDYLEGIWCSVYGGQETTQWEFTGDGDYRIGVPAGRGFAMQPDVRDLDNFHGRFETLLERQRDTFTTQHRHGRKNVFTRGPCN
ncbi:MAG: hypothetical protein ACNS61_00045 [Candidatus Wenzhouxiangella sp. M2_3B_020]